MSKLCKLCNNKLFRDHVKKMADGEAKDVFVCMNPNCQEYKKARYEDEKAEIEMQINKGR